MSKHACLPEKSAGAFFGAQEESVRAEWQILAFVVIQEAGGTASGFIASCWAKELRDFGREAAAQGWFLFAI